MTIFDLLKASDVAIERENLKGFLLQLFTELESKAIMVKYIQVGPRARDLFLRVLPEALEVPPVDNPHIIGGMWGAQIWFDPTCESMAVLSEPEFLSKAEMVFNTKG